MYSRETVLYYKELLQKYQLHKFCHLRYAAYFKF